MENIGKSVLNEKKSSPEMLMEKCEAEAFFSLLRQTSLGISLTTPG